MSAEKPEHRESPGLGTLGYPEPGMPAGPGHGKGYGSTEWKVHIAFALALVCMGAIAVVAHRSVVHLREGTAWVEHSHQVLHRLEVLFSDIVDAQNALRGYVLSGEPKYLDRYTKGLAAAGDDLRDVRQLTLNDREQQDRLNQVTASFERYRGYSARVAETRQEDGLDEARGLLLADQAEEFRADLRSRIGDVRELEHRLLEQRQQQAQRSAFVTDAVILAGSGLAVLLVGVASAAIRRDLVGRHRAEEALRRSEENLEVTLQSIGDAVVATDIAGHVTRMNRVAEELTGWLQVEARGRPVGVVLVLVQEKSGAPLTIPPKPVLPDGTQVPLPGPAAVVSRKGTTRSVSESAALIHAKDGRALGYVWVFRDVTVERAAIAKRREAEEELERFFSLSIDLLAISTGEGRFKRVSPAVTDILGWTPEEFTAQPYLDLVHPDDREATIAEVERQLKRGERVMQFENRYRHKDGSWRILSWRSAPFAGGIMYGAARDVTERRFAEEEIRRLNEDLRSRASEVEESNKELEAFSYSVSHDLRAPVRHIEGYAELPAAELGGTLPPESARFLGKISAAARRMNHLIDELLSFSKMGRMPLQSDVLDISALAGEVRSEMEMALQGRCIEWDIRPVPRVLGDRIMVKQVLANLMANAVKYTRPRNAARIEIGCAGSEEHKAAVYVRDNGVGFDMAQAGKLFGVFQRLHRASEFEGTGIGLANVHRIIARHGGRVWAEAQPGQGATFYFTLEAAAADERGGEGR